MGDAFTGTGTKGKNVAHHSLSAEIASVILVLLSCNRGRIKGLDLGNNGGVFAMVQAETPEL